MARKRRATRPPWYTVTRREESLSLIRQPVEDGRVWPPRIQPVCPLGRPGRRTCTQERPPRMTRLPITGSTVRTCVRGRREPRTRAGAR